MLEEIIKEIEVNNDNLNKLSKELDNIKWEKIKLKWEIDEKTFFLEKQGKEKKDEWEFKNLKDVEIFVKAWTIEERAKLVQYDLEINKILVDIKIIERINKILEMKYFSEMRNDKLLEKIT